MSVSHTPADARRLARTAGLKDLKLPHLEEVDRRRAQLWTLSLLVALALPAVMLAIGLDFFTDLLGQSVDVRTARLSLLALMVVVLGYVAEREVTLRRLTSLLVEERVLTASLVNRVDELNLLLRATRAMNSALALDQVLAQIAEAAHSLLKAGNVTVLLVPSDNKNELEVATSKGEGAIAPGVRQPIGAGLAGGAATRRDALLVAAGESASTRTRRHVGEALVVPMEVRGALVGVISVSAGSEREPFTEFDLRGVSVFADAAAAAITNARAYAEQLDRVATLVESDRAKDEFLTLVTHELRTPLTSVIGLLTTLSKRAGDLQTEQIQEYAQVARTQGWRLDRLIENLLDTSRAQRSALQVDPTPTDVVELARSTVTGLQAAAPDRTFTLEAEPMPPRLVDVDALLRILENLLSNAAKFSPPGSPVEVLVSETTNGLRLDVIDHGEGIPAEHHDTLYEKFERGADPYGRGGLGLGLYVVRALAEAHGGRVELSETPGGGATFSVWIAARLDAA